MIRKRKHKIRRKSSRNRERLVEKFLNSRLFIVLGAVFLLLGLYYSLHSSESSGSFSGVLMNLLRPSEDAQTIEVPGSGFVSLLLYFLPAALGLIVASWFAQRYSTITHPASLLMAFYLIVIQTKILVLNFNYGGCYYYSFFMASLFLFIPVLLFFMSALFHKRAEILVFACFYFYLSVVLYAANYSGRFEYLFPFVIIFSLAFYWIGQKIEKPAFNLINCAFAFGYLGIFWLRKFVVNTKPDFLILFLIFSALFYLLFYAIVIFASSKGEHPLGKWMQLVLNWSNLFFFLGTTFYVIFKYYTFGYLWIFVLALLLFNILGLYLLKRININEKDINL